MSAHEDEEEVRERVLCEARLQDGNRVERRRGSGRVQIVHVGEEFVIRFVDLEVPNREHVVLTVYLTHGPVPATGRLQHLRDATLLLLDVGVNGRLRGPDARGCFEQPLHHPQPTKRFHGVVVAKRAADFPATEFPQVHAFGNFERFQGQRRLAGIVLPEVLSKKLQQEKLMSEHVERLEALKDPEGKQWTMEDLKERTQEAFFRFDLDNTGRIEFPEFRAMMKHLGIDHLLDPQMRRLFVLCSDADGYMDLGGLESFIAMEEYLDASKVRPILLPHDIFATFDQDHDGLLNVFEFEAAVKVLGVAPHINHTHLQSAFRKQDESGRAVLVDAEGFRRAWLEVADPQAQLISRNHKPMKTLNPFKKKEVERINHELLEIVLRRDEKMDEMMLQQAHRNSIVRRQEKRKKKEEAVKARRAARFDEERLIKRARALEAKKAQKQREHEEYERKKNQRLESNLRKQVRNHARQRYLLESTVRRQKMEMKRVMEIEKRAAEGADILELAHKDYKEVPAVLYADRQALIRLSHYVLVDLSHNLLQTLPGMQFCYSLDFCQKLDVSHNRLELIPSELCDMCELLVLHMQHNKIQQLPDRWGMLRQLRRLDLSSNRLYELPPSLGQGLTALQTLKLFNNSLQQLPADVSGWNSLVTLELGENMLQGLPDNVGAMTSLETLDATSNRLVRLPASLDGLVSLRVLDVGQNSLRGLPPMGHLTSLQVLDATLNHIERLPSSIGGAKNLLCLTLSRNQVNTLPPEIGQLKRLERLELCHNHLTFLPPTVGRLTALKTMNIPANHLRSLPPEMGAMESLVELDLSQNQLEQLPPEFGYLHSLESLNLSHNGISSLPNTFSMLVELHDVNLARNSLTSPLSDTVGMLPELENLDLGNNALTFLPTNFGNLVRLRTLNAPANRLEGLPDEFEFLRSLESLDLYNNRLRAVPLALGKLIIDRPELVDHINLSSNPFDDLPGTFASQQATGYSTHEVLMWIKDECVYNDFALAEWQAHSAEYLASEKTGADFLEAVRVRAGKEWEPRLANNVNRFFTLSKRTGFPPEYGRMSEEARKRLSHGEEEVRQRRAAQVPLNRVASIELAKQKVRAYSNVRERLPAALAKINRNAQKILEERAYEKHKLAVSLMIGTKRRQLRQQRIAASRMEERKLKWRQQAFMLQNVVKNRLDCTKRPWLSDKDQLDFVDKSLHPTWLSEYGECVYPKGYKPLEALKKTKEGEPAWGLVETAMPSLSSAKVKLKARRRSPRMSTRSSRGARSPRSSTRSRSPRTPRTARSSVSSVSSVLSRRSHSPRTPRSPEGSPQQAGRRSRSPGRSPGRQTRRVQLPGAAM